MPVGAGGRRPCRSRARSPASQIAEILCDALRPRVSARAVARARAARGDQFSMIWNS